MSGNKRKNTSSKPRAKKQAKLTDTRIRKWPLGVRAPEAIGRVQALSGSLSAPQHHFGRPEGKYSHDYDLKGAEGSIVFGCHFGKCPLILPVSFPVCGSGLHIILAKVQYRHLKLKAPQAVGAYYPSHDTVDSTRVAKSKHFDTFFLPSPISSVALQPGSHWNLQGFVLMPKHPYA
ncbi:hypothetical protein BC629DRAFT_1445428 [Irpex lacteus]|nr:hypothetical protein BC629DRAFT_1445428 [Irpex lacteus]